MTTSRSQGRWAGLTAMCLAALVVEGARAQHPTETWHASGSLPAHIAAAFVEPAGFQRLSDGRTYVFDRRNHAVYRVAPGADRAEQLVEVGHEPGRLLRPGAFDMAPDGTFVVADAPTGRERIQIFSPDGARLGGFDIPGKAVPRVTLDGMVLNGIGSLQYTGRSILVNQPERGALITEYGLAGTPVRTIGRLRATGFDQDRDLHLALNTGVPLVVPSGGFYFVFQTGRPLVRKFDTGGRLLFERHIEGPELDPVLQALPERWPERPEGGLPVVPPTLRTATVEGNGHLWIALTGPYLYEYDALGEKIRTVQLVGARGPLVATSLSFDPQSRLLVTPGTYEYRIPR